MGEHKSMASIPTSEMHSMASVIKDERKKQNHEQVFNPPSSSHFPFGS
jgi:hypothetical protein